ncbi:MAG: hypothetical protein KKG59_02515, partial [Nanoarchaeota archaeon]|nr:hypothetical protein [Nanoarchaeota archaeon]
MMKSKWIFILLFVVIGNYVTALVFIPPIIYFASVSLIGFITNMFLFLAVWLAIKGFINRSYFGKPVHEIVSIVLGWIGKIVIIILSAIVPLLVLKPIIPLEIAISSLIAGVICLIVLFLNDFRRIRLIQKKEKLAMVRSVTLLSLVVIIITFASASFALETKALHIDKESGAVVQTDAPSVSEKLLQKSKIAGDFAGKLAEPAPSF